MFQFPAEDRFRKTEFGNAVTEHAAGFRLFVEHHAFDAGEPEIVCGGESRRTGSDDCDFFTVERREVFHVGVIVEIGGKTFEVVDGNRFAEDVFPAVFFAETRTDTTDGHRQRNAFLDDLQRLKEIAFASFADIFLHGSMRGTRHRAGSFAVAGMLGEQQVQGGAAHLLHFFGRCVDFLSFRRACRAGGEETAGFEVLHHTDEAGGGAGDFLIVAQGRNIQPHSSGHGKNRLSGSRGLRLSVDDEIDIRHGKYSESLVV